MSGNTFGKLFSVTTFGESHGPAIGCVIDGCPPGMALSEADIQPELDRRKPGTSRHVTQRQEGGPRADPVGRLRGRHHRHADRAADPNEDQRSKDYGNIVETFRPGHADYTYWHKYGVRDPRGGGRSSARLTAPVVGAGAIAKKWLREHYGIEFMGCMSQLGDIEVPFESWEHVHDNPFFAATADAALIARMEAAMDELRRAGDSIGARIDVVAKNVPVGLASRCTTSSTPTSPTP
jgi:chorismate synthase